MRKCILGLLFTCSFLASQVYAADNLLLVTIDGLRWQEVFRGYQDDVLALPEFEKHRAGLEQDFAGKNSQQKRQKLMPFMWSSIANQGVIIGNRDLDSRMSVTNTLWFSYPGYNEILTKKKGAEAPFKIK